MGFLDQWVESLDYEYEILTSCTRHKSPHSTCQKCIDVCKEVAVTLVNNKPVIDQDKCIECGKCISACPVQAVAGIFPKRTVFQNKLLVTGDNAPTVKEMLVLYKTGIKEIIWGDSPKEDIWEDSSMAESWLQVIHEANLTLQQLGEASFTVSNKTFEKTEEVYSRRELLSQWKKESQSLMKQFAPAKWRFNHTNLEVAKYYPEYQFTNISLDPDICTLCKACVLLCEKKCLTITESSFSIMAQTCSSCHLCVDICSEKAMMLDDKISKVKVIHYPIYIRKCSLCNQEYDSLDENGEKCPTCTKGFLSPFMS